MAIPRGRHYGLGADHQRNTVAVVSDATAMLGLDDIGPAAAMPVMEGKAMLFKEFAGVDAFPLCIDTKDSTRSSASSRRWPRPSAASTSRTSPRRAASRSSGGCARSSRLMSPISEATANALI
jgi:malic enzyme